VCFSKYDVMRSIPSLVDGFKPTQRKVLYCAFKRNLKSDIKVAHLAGYISEHSAYHHGEVSLQGTIINMAQTFVGSNNVNLLVPSGQFGTRLMGGKDAASARYIYTRLERIARLIFHPDDDPLLEFQNEDGQIIEPKWYIPVIPLVLVNGAEGIGTGWCTSLPNYNPRDLIRLLRLYISGKPIKENLCPWYKGFKGSIVCNDTAERSGYEVVGLASKTSPNTIEITELPVRKWTQDYKEFLAKLVEGDGEGSKGRFDDFKEYHTENEVHFVLSGSAEQIKSVETEGMEKVLKLRGTISTNNIVLFDKEGKIKKFSKENELLMEFANLRFTYYQKRKDYHIDRLGREKEHLDSKVRFILMVIKGELVVSNRKRLDLVSDLKSKGFRPYTQIFPKSANNSDATSAADTTGGEKGNKHDYDYLLGMPIWSLTWERVEDLRRQMQEKTDELNALERRTVQHLWEADLAAIEAELMQSMSGTSRSD